MKSPLTSDAPKDSVDTSPVERSYSITDIAAILDMPVQTVFEWLLEGRLFVHPAGPGVSLRLSDPDVRRPFSL